jgi:phage terminase large subunit
MKYNPNLDHLVYCYLNGYNAALEGSGRAGKTWSVIDFIVIYCSDHKGQNKTINIIRETYNSFKTTLYLDFARRLPMWNIASKFGLIKDIASFNLFGNTINFMGADDPNKFLGAGCDIFWCNEFLDIPKMIFDQSEQRCREMWIGDWNPKTSDHWVFDLEKRPDVKFIRTTFRDNPGISRAELKKVLSYDPANPENVSNGTADEYMWKVYGMGERASLTGLVYNNVTFIDEIPADCSDIAYGLDFGHTNSATALVRVGRKGNNIYTKLLFYEPCDDVNVLSQVLTRYVGNGHVWADSAEDLLISKLRTMGHVVLPAYKPAGSVMDGITICKSYKLHAVRDVNLKKEYDNYKWREVGGVVLNEPVKGYDHAMDAKRYAITMQWR